MPQRCTSTCSIRAAAARRQFARAVIERLEPAGTAAAVLREAYEAFRPAPLDE